MLAGEDKSTSVLYSNSLAENLELEALYEQHGFYLSCGAELFLLGRNLIKANQLLEIHACTNVTKRRDMQILGKFMDNEVKHAAMHVARFRSRGVAAGVSVPLLWLVWRFAMHERSRD